MIPLNYHHLYYFWTVARRGSISAAAQELYLSQPTLSGQLKQLERSLKLRLLVRGRSGVTLTPEGRAVFERCARIFAEGEELAAFVKGGPAAPAVLRIGLRPTVTREVMLKVLEFAHALDQTSRVLILSGDADVLVGKLKHQALDLVIANQDFSAGEMELRGRLVSKLPVYFVAHPSVRRRVKRFPADLSKVPLLVRPEETGVRKQVDDYLGRRRIECEIEADSDDSELLRRLAIAGKGVTVLSGLAAAEDLKARRLATLHSHPVGIEEPIWFISRSHPPANEALRRMVEALMSEFTLFGRVPAVRSRLGA